MRKIIAIDGPAGSGKGTVCKILSKECNLLYIDTGAMYRAIAYLTLKYNIDIKDEDSIVKLASSSKIRFDGDSIFINDINVTDDIRTNEVTSIVSPISSIVKLREILVSMQRELAKDNDVIMEGRDITTVVFPDAQYKFYLDASLDERVKRRYKQNMEKGIISTLDEIKTSISARDYNDMNKKVGALTRTEDQIYIDSTNLTISEVVDKIKNMIEVK